MLRLLTFIALIIATLPAKAQERRALLIGNQAYAREVGALANPINDVNLVAASLRQIGFSNRNITIVKNGDRRTILRAIDRHAKALKAAGSDAVGFLYYSGHGAANNQNRRNYLIPVGVKKLNADVWYDSIPLDDIVSSLKTLSANAAHFVIFDACRNLLNLPTKGGKGFIPVATRRGMLIAFSTDPGQTASDAGRGSGPYASALAAELVKPGIDHLDLFQNVKEAVYAQTQTQVPWTRDGMLQRVYLSGKSSGDVPASQAAGQKDKPGPTTDRTAAATTGSTSPGIPGRVEAFKKSGQRFSLPEGRSVELGEERALLSLASAYTPNGGSARIRLEGKGVGLSTGQHADLQNGKCRIALLHVKTGSADFRYSCNQSTGASRPDEASEQHAYIRSGQSFTLATGQSAELGQDRILLAVKHAYEPNGGNVSFFLDGRNKSLKTGRHTTLISGRRRCTLSVRRVTWKDATFRLRCR